LALGKPLGIVLACAAAVGLGLARLPAGVNWTTLTGGACLAGIGFTMALFLNGLAFPDPEFTASATAAKLGILVGSAASAVAGGALLILALRPSKPT
jgi:NhaA family Na+:H+ antiporter